MAGMDEQPQAMPFERTLHSALVLAAEHGRAEPPGTRMPTCARATRGRGSPPGRGPSYPGRSAVAVSRRDHRPHEEHACEDSDGECGADGQPDPPTKPLPASSFVVQWLDAMAPPAPHTGRSLSVASAFSAGNLPRWVEMRRFGFVDKSESIGHKRPSPSETRCTKMASRRASSRAGSKALAVCAQSARTDVERTQKRDVSVGRRRSADRG